MSTSIDSNRTNNAQAYPVSLITHSLLIKTCSIHRFIVYTNTKTNLCLQHLLCQMEFQLHRTSFVFATCGNILFLLPLWFLAACALPCPTAHVASLAQEFQQREHEATVIVVRENVMQVSGVACRPVFARKQFSLKDFPQLCVWGQENNESRGRHWSGIIPARRRLYRPCACVSNSPTRFES